VTHLYCTLEPQRVPVDNHCAADINFKFIGFSMNGKVRSLLPSLSYLALLFHNNSYNSIHLLLDSRIILLLLISQVTSGGTDCGANAGSAGVTITLNSNPPQTTTTDAKGSYSFHKVLPGTYKVTASHPSWKISPVMIHFNFTSLSCCSHYLSSQK
jgi:hypothetical protein